MLAYQKSLLDYGMLILNFFDAISEGDGNRLLRCWKFFLMFLKHQEGTSSKYALEALYLMFQVYALLSPQASHRLIWNRFIKNKPGIGGHIPLDLQLEFYNKIVKEAIKNLGPNAAIKSIDRICHSFGRTTDLMNVFYNDFKVFKRSGKHFKKSTNDDLNKIVKELVVQQAFTYTTGRNYRLYSGVESSLVTGLYMRNFPHIQTILDLNLNFDMNFPHIQTNIVHVDKCQQEKYDTVKTCTMSTFHKTFYSFCK